MSPSTQVRIKWMIFAVCFTVVGRAFPATRVRAAVNVIHHWDMGATNIAKGDKLDHQVDAPGGFGTPGQKNYGQLDLGTGPKLELQNSVGSKGPVYTGNAAPGCKVAIRFTGDAYESLDSAACIKLHQDFGFQLWVKAKDNSDRMIAYNGNPAKNGCGFIQHHGHLEGLLGGVAFIKGPKIIPDQWVNLALVVSRAKTKLYVNARDYASCKSVPKPPSPALDGDGFWIGSQRKIQTAYCSIDDVKIFTFIPGGFAVRDLACADKKR